jgi:hypothetical protein
LCNRIHGRHADLARHVARAKNAAVEASGIDPRFHRLDICGVAAA